MSTSTNTPALAVALLLGLWSSPAQASPLTDLAESLEPGDWGELATEEIDAVLSASGASGIQIGYSEDIVWDPQSKQLLFVGGDHNDIADLVVYSEATNTWQTLDRPDWIPGSTMHGYDHSAIDPSRRFLYHRPFGNNAVHRYDIDAGMWTDVPPPPDNGTSCCDALEFFPDMDGILWSHHSYDELWLFSEGTQEWSLIDDALPAGTTWEVAEYNPVHHLVVLTAADTLYQLANNGTVTEIGPLGQPIYDGSGFTGVLTVDPVSGDFLVSTPAGESNRTFHVFDVIENAWAELPTQPAVDLTHTAMVATPIADYGITVFVYCYGNTPCGVLAYKHSPFDIPPDPETSTGDDGEGDGTATSSNTTGDVDGSSGGAEDSTPMGTASGPTGADDSGGGEGGSNEDDNEAEGCACRASHPWRAALLPWVLMLCGVRRRRSRSV